MICRSDKKRRLLWAIPVVAALFFLSMHPLHARGRSGAVHVTLTLLGNPVSGSGSTLDGALKDALPSRWKTGDLNKIVISSDVHLREGEMRKFFDKALASLPFDERPDRLPLSRMTLPAPVAVDLRGAKMPNDTLPLDLFKGRCIGEIVLPEGLAEIPHRAFLYCYLMSSIRVPDSLVRIEAQAFAGCASLRSISLPDGVAHIGQGAFTGSGLRSFSFPRSLTTIESGVLGFTQSLERVSIPDSVTSIEEQAFVGSNLREVQIPSSVLLIGKFAFQRCPALLSASIFSAAEVGEGAFYECQNLRSVDIRSRTARIGSEAFKECTSLSSVTLPDTVSSIGDGAFEECNALASISLPRSLELIGGNAFAGCGSLRSIAIPERVAQVGKRAFAGCGGLRSIALPKSVASVGENAFADCSALVSASISDAVSTIARGMFRNCANLASVSLPKSLASIETEAFAGCRALVSLPLPVSLREIDLGAFASTGIGFLKVPEGTLLKGASSQVEILRLKARATRPEAESRFAMRGTFTPVASQNAWWLSKLPERRKIALPLKVSIAASEDGILLTPGSSRRLTVNVRTEGLLSFETREGKWSTSNPRVATVDKNGLVRATGPGSALVVYGAVAKATLKDASGDIRTIDDWPVFASCRVTVR